MIVKMSYNLNIISFKYDLKQVFKNNFKIIYSVKTKTYVYIWEISTYPSGSVEYYFIGKHMPGANVEQDL